MKKKINILFLLLVLIMVGGVSCADHRNDNIPDNSVYLVTNGNIVSDINILQKARVFVYRAGKFGKAVSVTLDTYTKAEMDAYNKANLTKYSILPDSCYDVNAVRTTVTYSKKEQDVNRIVRFAFNKRQITNFMNQFGTDGNTYIVPVKIRSASVKINTKLDSQFFHPILNND